MVGSSYIPVAEERDDSFPIWVIDGETGTGKTYTYVNFPYESGLVFSFDGQVKRILNQFPERKPHWRVIDALRYYDVGESVITHSAERTHDYIRQVLRCYDTDPDVRSILRSNGVPASEFHDPVEAVVFDGFQMLSEVEEMRMRGRNKLGPFEGFSNRGLWKSRRLGIRELVRAAERAALKAVIVTTYPQRVDVVKDGVLIETRSPPNWYDIIEKESGLWLRNEKDTDVVKGQDKFYVSVKKSRFRSFLQGKRYAVPYGSTFTDIIGKTAFFDLENVGRPPPLPSDLAALPADARIRESDEGADAPVGEGTEEDELNALMSGHGDS